MTIPRLSFHRAVGHAIERITWQFMPEFRLHDLYQQADRIRSDSGSRAKNIEASIRHMLQRYRDRGLVEFIDNRGSYRCCFRLIEAPNQPSVN